MTFWVRHRLDALALGSLLLLSLAYFWRPLLTPGVWVPMGGGDMVSFIYPMFAFAARSVASGDLPLWNPHLHAGMPFAADLQNGLFYPLNWPALVQGTSFHYRHLEAVVLVHYPLSGGLAYLFARDLGLSRPAAWLGGTAFMLSGFMVTHLGHANMVQSATWLPLELLLARRAVLARSLPLAGGVGLTVALAFFAGHTQVVMLQLLVLAAYVVTLPPQPWIAKRVLGWRLLVVVSVGAVSAFASAVKLLPGAELTRNSIRADLPFERAIEFAAQPVGLATLLLPHVWGTNPTNYWGPWSNTEVLGYIGVLPMLLALIGLLLARSFQPQFFIGLAAVALLLSLGDTTALFGWVYRFVPGFDLVRAAGRFLYLFDFGVAIAAAYGFDALRRVAASERGVRGETRIVLRWAALGVAAALLAVLGVALPVLLAQQVANADVATRVVTAISDLFLLAAYLAAALLLLGGLLLRWFTPAAVTALVLCVATLDLASAYQQFNPTTVDPRAGFRQEELVEVLRTSTGHVRVDGETGAIGAWQPDTASVLGIFDAGGLFNPMQLSRYAEFRKSVGRAYLLPAYDLLNVRFLVAPRGFQAAEPRLSAAGIGDLVFLKALGNQLELYEHRGGLPRARIVYQAESVTGLQDALNLMRQPSFDPRSVVLVEGPAIATSTPPDATTAQILEYGNDSVVLQAEAAADGYLVLADTVYPGWRATVDGRAEPVVTAYGVFRAVRVGPGTHVVRFDFAPLSWEIGWRVSVVTWAFMAAVGLRLLWRTLIPGRRGSAALAPAALARDRTT